MAIVLVAGAGVAAYALGMPYLEAKVFKTEVEVTEIALVSPAQASVELTSTGYIVAQSVSKVAAKVPGKVIKANFREGAHVNAGDVLFELDPSDVKASIATAASQTAAAKARAQTARANLSEASVQLTRAQALAKDGIGPKSAAEDLEARVASLQEMVKAADAEAQASNAAVGALGVTLTSFKLIAPISRHLLAQQAAGSRGDGGAATGRHRGRHGWRRNRGFLDARGRNRRARAAALGR